LTSNGQRSRSRGVENVKIVFRVYLRQKWIDLRQTKTKMINGPFYTYLRIHHRKCIVSVIIVCLSVCLPVTYLSFTLYWNVTQEVQPFYGQH